MINFNVYIEIKQQYKQNKYKQLVSDKKWPPKIFKILLASTLPLSG